MQLQSEAFTEHLKFLTIALLFTKQKSGSAWESMLLGGRTNISLGEYCILKHIILRWKVSLVSPWINTEASEELQDTAQVIAYVLLFAKLELGKANHSVWLQGMFTRILKEPRSPQAAHGNRNSFGRRFRVGPWLMVSELPSRGAPLSPCTIKRRQVSEIRWYEYSLLSPAAQGVKKG